MKNYNADNWRSRITTRLALTQESVAIRHQRDLLINAALEEIVSLHSQGRLTEDRWREISRQIWTILPGALDREQPEQQVSKAVLQ